MLHLLTTYINCFLFFSFCIYFFYHETNSMNSHFCSVHSIKLRVDKLHAYACSKRIKPERNERGKYNATSTIERTKNCVVKTLIYRFCVAFVFCNFCSRSDWLGFDVFNETYTIHTQMHLCSKLLGQESSWEWTGCWNVYQLDVYLLSHCLHRKNFIRLVVLLTKLCEFPNLFPQNFMINLSVHFHCDCKIHNKNNNNNHKNKTYHWN